MQSSWDDTATGARISAEFQGRARQFHSWLIIESQKSLAEMHRIRTGAEQLSDRRSTHPRPMRPEVLTEIERGCQRAPMDGCLRRTVQRDRKTMQCSNIWLIPVIQRANAWDASEAEPAIDILSDVMDIDRYGVVHRNMCSRATVSLHALARWYSRAFATDREALMGDLLHLFTFAESAAQDLGREFELETGNGGAWRGGVGESTCPWGDRSVCHVRTFF